MADDNATRERKGWFPQRSGEAHVANTSTGLTTASQWFRGSQPAMAHSMLPDAAWPGLLVSKRTPEVRLKNPRGPNHHQRFQGTGNG